jgi:hypothetical protein
MCQKTAFRPGCAVGCVALCLVVLGLVGSLYWWGTRPAREARWAHAQLRAGMTLVELGRVLGQREDWLCVLRPPGLDDERRVNLSRRDGQVLYFGQPESAWTPPSAVLDEQGAVTLARGMGPGEWTVQVQFVGLLMIHELDLTLDAGRRVKSFTSVRQRAPHG